MKKLLLRLGLSVLGTAITLIWWTYHDKGSNAQSMNHIPTRVAQGGNQLVIEVQGSTDSTMRVDFEDVSKPSGQQILLNAWQKVPAGSHSWTIDIPSGIGGYIEFEADHPNPGDLLTQRVKINGKEVDSQTERLDSPLQPNTAFFVQLERDDFSRLEASPQE